MRSERRGPSAVFYPLAPPKGERFPFAQPLAASGLKPEDITQLLPGCARRCGVR